MDYYAVGLCITIITAIISLSICACCCKINTCSDRKYEHNPLLDTHNYVEINVSV